MKTILQKIILLISIVTFSPESFIGKYCSIPVGESDVTCTDFMTNFRFEYKFSGCLGLSAIGSGKFEIKNDQLNLIFDKEEQPNDSIL